MPLLLGENEKEKVESIIDVNSMNSKFPINATSLLGLGTKISDDDQKILIKKLYFY